MTKRSFLLLTFLALVTIFCTIALAAPKSLRELKTTFFTDLDGNKRDLMEYRGRVLLLNFWASWCAPCLMEVPELNRMHERYQPRGLELISLSLDTEYGLTRIKDIAQRSRMRYSVGKAHKEMVEDLKIYAIPMSILYGKDGTMIKQFMGPPNPTVLKKEIEQALNK